jgi:hypothetical protein
MENNNKIKAKKDICFGINSHEINFPKYLKNRKKYELKRTKILLTPLLKTK